MKKKLAESALNVQGGIAQPAQINDSLVEALSKKRTSVLTKEEVIEGITLGDRRILAQAITLVESARPEHRQLASEIIQSCLQHEKRSVRIGITGVPGVGKSTFIETFGLFLTQKGYKVAVLAIDPSSQRSKGSILGDKTRMENLSVEPNAFIRPSPSSGSLGGVAQKTRESITLCEAAGYDVIIIETVGVGQSEIAVHGMVDFFLLLMLAGAGDELQGIKRGIIEMSDALVINKADGDNLKKAEISKVQYANALHLFPLPESGWTPVTDICSAYTGFGIENVWNHIQNYLALTQNNGYFALQRKQQESMRLLEQIESKLKERFFESKGMKARIEQALITLALNQNSAYQLAEELLNQWQKEVD